MSDKLMSGTEVSKVLYEELREYLKTKSVLPKVIDISIGDDFGGEMYAKMKKKKVEAETGFSFESRHYDNISYDELINEINIINASDDVYGVMIQLPLPDELRSKERDILDHISVGKDVDGLNSGSLGNLMVGKTCMVPCTPKGIIVLLKAYGVELSGKRVAIINRSNIVGKPLEQLFLMENATTTICHSKTNNLKEVVKEADIVVAALNKQEFITADFIKDGAIVIDVGVHRNSEGKTVGDVKFDEVYNKCSLITPPTGGVGPMTICMLGYNSAYGMYGDEVFEVLERGIEKAKVKVLEK